MKSGLTIVEMAQQIERQSKLKQDYLLDTAADPQWRYRPHPCVWH